MRFIGKVAAVILALAASGARAHEILRHDLEVTLEPDRHRLRGTDTITFRVEGEGPLILSIDPALDPAKNGLIHRHLPARGRRRATVSVPFGGPGVRINPEFTLLEPENRWYPTIPGRDDPVPFRLTVRLTPGQEAIGSGNLVGREASERGTVTIFEMKRPAEGIVLAAGPFRIAKERVGGIDLYTYFLPGSEGLVPIYMEAAKKHLTHYMALIGPYPFSHFAVVENPEPSGFGFAGFTLLGSSVLRLPFIPMGSLRHEVLHNWWGNGVYPDYDTGNWSEALTVFMADYAAAEEEGADAAAEARRRMLKNYAAYVKQNREVPLQEFRERDDSALRAIGYDKGAMVFQMLDTMIGREKFLAAVRKVAVERMFERTGWDDWRRAFEEISGRPLDWFFRQWIDRAGAPLLALKDVRARKIETGYEVAFEITQEEPTYRLHLPVLIATEEGEERREIEMQAARETFTFPISGAPRRLSIDPDARFFRRLSIGEIPPSLGEVYSADPAVVILPPRADPERSVAYRELLAALFERPPKVISTSELPAADRRPIALFGTLEENPLLAELLPTAYPEGWDSFRSDGDVRAIAWRRGERSLLWVEGFSAEAIRKAIRPLPHYGGYGYAAFRQGKNVLKGEWSVSSSLDYAFGGDEDPG